MIIQEITVVLSQGEMTATHCLGAGIFSHITAPGSETSDILYQISHEGAS